MELITRSDAALKGLRRYFTGELCLYGHITERYTANTKCLGCIPRIPRVPKKQGATIAPNIFWAMTPFVFDRSAGVLSPEEMQSAIAYVQKAGWHDAALQALRKK